MKFTMALGGFLGFGIGLLFGWAQGSASPSWLWRASVTALLAGLLLRWWGRLWVGALRQLHDQRQAASSPSPEAKSKPSLHP